MILMNAKRPDRYIPGPSDYKPEKVIIASTKLYKWSTEKRNSIIDMIQKEEKQKVGPAQYSCDQVYKDKIKGVYLQQKATKEGLTGEVEYLSMQTPCANHYNSKPEVTSQYTGIQVANFKRDMTKRCPTPKEDKGPSPVSYPEKDKNWIYLSHQQRIPMFTIEKQKQSRFLDVHVKKKAYVPGVGTHKDNGIE